MFWWIDKIVQNKSVQQLQRRSVIRLWVAAPPEYLLHVARTTDCSVKEARLVYNRHTLDQNEDVAWNGFACGTSLQR